MRYFVCLTIVFLLGGAGNAWGNPGVLEASDRLLEENKFSECRDWLEKGLVEADAPAGKAEIYWRLSRITYLLTERKKQSKTDPATLLADYEKGVAWAGKALTFDATSYQAHFWRASHWGSWAQVKGSLDALGKTSAAKEDLLAAIRLKPDYAPAYYVLGLLYIHLPGWPISFGNKEFGVSMLRQAIDLAEKPEGALGYHLNLALALWERNWNLKIRNDKRKSMAGQYAQKSDPGEKSYYYEGVADFSRGVFSGGKTWETLSDREEATALLSYAEKQAALLIKKPEDVKKFTQAVKTIRDRLR